MEVDVRKILILLARKEKSKAGLAAEANLSRQAVTNIFKSGKCKPETAGKIAKALGVDVAEIIDF